MLRLVKSTWGDVEKFTGDIRTHLMAIDPDQIDQFMIVTENGVQKTYAPSQIGLNDACRLCLIAGLSAPRSDDALKIMANGFHDKPLALHPRRQWLINQLNVASC